ncbi:amidoligase family protein [Pseudooceanicola sp. MF1-13]|uniref:amidoligase family protein n=1 Tax=Pseudooceanicola sp. MF1-13 TaxID=3379095 RepID=UPI00389247F3
MTDSTFKPLPKDTDFDGNPRLTGVEIEYSGVSAEDTAKIATRVLGGEAENTDEHAWEVTGSEIGKIEIYLDTALRYADDSAAKKIGLDVGKAVIPVELVTEPLTRDQMVKLDELRDALRKEGAEGTRSGMAYGFGVHFNPAIASCNAEDITAPLIAYALIEDWMRKAEPIDLSRRVLPFTDPYPTDLVKAFCDAGVVEPARAMELYLEHAPSRNYGLDMLPIFAWLDEKTVRDALGDDPTSARPTFHFRLPDSRIDEKNWSLAMEWDRWRLVETIAADRDLLDRLMSEWLDQHGSITLRRSPWAERCGEILSDAGLVKEVDFA